VLVLRGHQAAVMSLAIRYGGSQSALAAEHHAQHDNAWSISSCDTDPDVLVSAGFDRSVRVWSLSGCSAGSCLHALNIAGRLTSIASHFEYFVAGGENGTIFVLQLDASGCSLVVALDASATTKVQSVLSVGPYVLCATTKSGVLIYKQHDFDDCKSLQQVRAMSTEDKVHHLAWLSGRLFVATSERVEVYST
jgi:WD40 repeat protein